MYHKGKAPKKDTKPFSIECSNCGSHNVTILACEYKDLLIECNTCRSYLDTDWYNETTYIDNTEFDEGE